MMKRRYKRRLAAALALAVLLLAACGKGIPMALELRGGGAYSVPVTMIVAVTEYNRYEELYTDEIWAAGEAGDLQEQLLRRVRRFMETVKTMNLLAEEKGIRLTSAEQDQIAALAEAYYEGLTASEIEYMKVGPDDVKEIYGDYRIADKLVDELTRDVDLEVSDDEARTITVAEIRLEDAETAQAVLEQVNQPGADFEAIARQNSTGSEIRRQIGKGGEGTYENVVFALAKDQISEVVEYGGSYYILKCLSDYDEEATQENKKRISEERKKQAFYEVFGPFQKDHQVSYDDNVWKQVTLDDDNPTTTTNFFELYRQEFPDQ